MINKNKLTFCILIIFLIVFSYSDNTSIAIIELMWSKPSDYVEFIQKNLSMKGTYSTDSFRNLIIINENQDRLDFIESNIRKRDISKGKKSNLGEKHPVFIEVNVRDYEQFSKEIEIFTGEEIVIDKTHPLIYLTKQGEKENYNVEMLGPKFTIWFEKLSLQKVFVKLDIEYTYLMGWKSGTIPVIDQKRKSISEEFFVGDIKFFENIILGNRIIDCKLKIGYNMLSVK
ncbi:MAG: hypothetical protein M0R46_03115 [Candidatus Muirbacterium halophilum]|nr:hypothetical protein [Candidatus Muirbacterium halophilum]MCK9474881.1 hypothetical protein [Candidatus Muirbacterium halophilum]